MTDPATTLIRRLNQLSLAVWAVLGLIVLGGLIAVRSVQPKHVDRRVERVEKSLEDVRQQIQDLRNDLKTK